MIDRIYVLTLRRCVDRHQAWLAASQMRDIPLDIVSFVEGHDDKGFGNMSEVAEFAAVDGFDFVEEYAVGTRTEYVEQTIASVCQVWNIARILRHIAANDEVCLVIFDDKMITVSFNVLNIIVSELLAVEDEEFFLLQLLQRGDLNELEFREHDRFEQHDLSTAVFKAIFNRQISSYGDFFLRHGIVGYDETMVLSPEGADWVLGCLGRAKDFYTFFDHFIHKRLTEEAHGAVEHGKGLYCPRESGYAFVSEIMPMGSVTGWAPEGSFHYENANQKTEVSWKEVD